jgi:tRNA nucleotidyltransferase (CCA-adding enzyme)
VDSKLAFIRVLRLLLRSWSYYKHLESVTLAGSHAKGTDLRNSDVDLFLTHPTRPARWPASTTRCGTGFSLCISR